MELYAEKKHTHTINVAACDDKGLNLTALLLLRIKMQFL